MDLIVPIRLKLDQNNNKIPSGSAKIASDSKKIFKINKIILRVCFENRLLSHVPIIIHQPKLFQIKYSLNESDALHFKIRSIVEQILSVEYDNHSGQIVIT